MREMGWGMAGLCAALVLACSGSSSGGQATDQGGAGSTASGGTTSGGTSGGDSGSGGTGNPGGSGSSGTGGAGSGGATGSGTSVAAPVKAGHWSSWGTDQGLTATIYDVSADEGGQVYVAAGDALFAKRRDDDTFLRFDGTNTDITQNCYAGVPDENAPGFADALLARNNPTPPGPARVCPIISVAGAAPGKAIIGFRGQGTDQEQDADWAQDGGGADVVAFDGAKLSRTRHVFLASPPGLVCLVGTDKDHLRETFDPNCSSPWDPYFFQVGRRKLRQVHRIVVNHDASSRKYGDAFMGGTHASIAALLANTASRGWVDYTAGKGAKWVDAKDVWEHDHPAITANGVYLTGLAHGLAIHPGSGTPWTSNGFRTAWLAGYGDDLSSDVFWLRPEQQLWYDIWPDGSDPLGAGNDNVESLSFCPDGTLWAGSSTHGLARFDGATWTGVGLPDPGRHGNSVTAVACDPSDGSLWIGLGWGGVMRLKNGSFSEVPTAGLPAFAGQPVRSIQIDAWATPDLAAGRASRVVWFAFLPLRDASGQVTSAGGVASYDGT